MSDAVKEIRILTLTLICHGKAVELLSIYLILAAALGPGVYSASNRNE
jgi:hypothetical protein